MGIPHPALSCKLASNFYIFSIYAISGEKGWSLRRLGEFLWYWISVSRKYLSSLFSLWLFIKNLSNSEISSTHLKSFTGIFYDIAQPCKSFTSQYLRYDDSLFLIKYFMDLLLDFACR